MLVLRAALIATVLPLGGCVEAATFPEEAPGTYVGEYNGFVDTIALHPNGRYERKIVSPAGTQLQAGEWAPYSQKERAGVRFSGWSALCDRSANEVEPCPFVPSLHASVPLKRTSPLSFHPQGLYLEVWRSDETGQYFYKQPKSG